MPKSGKKPEGIYVGGQLQPKGGVKPTGIYNDKGKLIDVSRTKGVYDAKGQRIDSESLAKTDKESGIYHEDKFIPVGSGREKGVYQEDGTKYVPRQSGIYDEDGRKMAQSDSGEWLEHDDEEGDYTSSPNSEVEEKVAEGEGNTTVANAPTGSGEQGATEEVAADTVSCSVSNTLALDKRVQLVPSKDGSMHLFFTEGFRGATTDLGEKFKNVTVTIKRQWMKDSSDVSGRTFTIELPTDVDTVDSILWYATVGANKDFWYLNSDDENGETQENYDLDYIKPDIDTSGFNILPVLWLCRAKDTVLHPITNVKYFHFCNDYLVFWSNKPIDTSSSNPAEEVGTGDNATYAFGYNHNKQNVQRVLMMASGFYESAEINMGESKITRDIFIVSEPCEIYDPGKNAEFSDSGFEPVVDVVTLGPTFVEFTK